MTFTQNEKNQLLSQLRETIKAVEAMPVQKNCHTCANYDLGGANPICRAAGITPPADVIEVGCDAYIYDHTLPPF